MGRGEGKAGGSVGPTSSFMRPLKTQWESPDTMLIWYILDVPFLRLLTPFSSMFGELVIEWYDHHPRRSGMKSDKRDCHLIISEDSHREMVTT